MPAAAGPDDDAADRVQAAFHAGAELRPLVSLDPDPWVVADELCRRGDFDAAAAFGAADPRPLAAGLAAYVAARRERPSPQEAYVVFAKARQAMQAGNMAAALSLLEDVGADGDVIALRLRQLRGDALGAMGATREARDAYVVVAAGAQKLGWLRRTADVHFRAGTCSRAAGDLDDALSHWQTALELLEKVGHRSNEAHVLNAIGVARFDRGEYTAARDAHAKACELSRETADTRGIAQALTLLGGAQLMLGDYAAAVSEQEESLALRERLGSGADIVQVLQNKSLVHRRLGDVDQARADLTRAKDLCEKGRLDRPLLLVLLALAGVEEERGDVAASDILLRSAGTLADSLGDPVLAARVQGSLGQNRRGQREWEAAVRHFRGALDLAEKAASAQVAALARQGLGEVALAQGRFADARALLGQAVESARALGDRPMVARCLSTLARVCLTEGDPAGALALAGDALAQGSTLARGLSFEEGVKGRAAKTWHIVGVEAALAADDAEAMYRFVEGGRAGALLEALGGREAVRSVEIPLSLAREREDLAAAVAAATDRSEQAVRTGVRDEIRNTRAELDAARARLQRLDSRIERRRREVAAAAAPEPIPLAQVQARLGLDHALVLYELGLEEGLALVVTPTRPRLVRLGPTAEIEAACEALHIEDRGADPSDALAHLRALLADPLKLPDAVRTVLVSPDGPLTFVPFSLLLGARAVSLVPSGSVAARLAAEVGPGGTGVLAIGDPACSRLPRLPGARAEAQALGTHVLLGTEATEVAFWKALSGQPRWRAVHFACHGIVDVRHPTLSGLVLTPAPGEDGILTALEIGRHDFAADLVVLSGCETGRGKVFGSEGMVGIVGAFTLAGSPRVLASLWPVDDEATAELMRVFYRSWNEQGRGAADALRTAQEAVRERARWRHPAYWAAWVLWGPS